VSNVDTSVEGFENYVSRVCSESTAGKYGSAVKDFLRVVKENGYGSFAELPSGILNRYVEILIEGGYAPSSVHVYIAGVKRYLGWIEGQGVKVASFGKIDMPRKKHVMRDILNPDMLEAYFANTDELLTEPVRTAALLLPCTGLRATEISELPLIAIRKVDIKLHGKTQRMLALRVDGKGGKERTVPIIDEGSQILTGYLNGYRRARKGPYVFPGMKSRHNKTGNVAMSTRTLRDGVAKVRQPLGLKFTPHTMRRTYLVSLWRRGVDAVTLAKIAGHTNIQTLFQHYLALDEHDVVRAVEMASKERN
jgi:site-specific recombinase XerD